MQGNCEAPPTEEEARQMNLPDSAVASLQAVRPGQCMLLLNKRGIVTERFSKWIDNLHIAFVSENVEASTAVGISVSKSKMKAGTGTNVFITRTTFHAMDGLRAAQALAIETALLSSRGHAVFPTSWSNNKHSLLFEGSTPCCVPSCLTGY